MPFKYKILYIFFVGGMFLSFVMMTTFYPFARFGMFAEPPQYTIQKSKMLLYCQKKNSYEISLVRLEKFGMTSSYVDNFLKNWSPQSIDQVGSVLITQSVDFDRLQLYQKNLLKGDSVLVYEFIPKK